MSKQDKQHDRAAARADLHHSGEHETLAGSQGAVPLPVSAGSKGRREPAGGISRALNADDYEEVAPGCRARPSFGAEYESCLEGRIPGRRGRYGSDRSRPAGHPSNP